MSVVDRTVPYELLFLFGDDGLLKVGQYIDRRIVEIDGERVSDQPGLAKPIGASPDEVKALLSGAALTALAEIDRLNGLQADHERDVATLRGQLSEANDCARSAEAKTERLEVELMAREATLKVREADIVRIEVQLEQARLSLAEARAQITELTAPLEEEPV